MAIQHHDPLGKLIFLGSKQELPLLLAWKLSTASIHQKLMEVNGNDAMSRQHVAKWCSTLAFGRDNMTADNQSG